MPRDPPAALQRLDCSGLLEALRLNEKENEFDPQSRRLGKLQIEKKAKFYATPLSRSFGKPARFHKVAERSTFTELAPLYFIGSTAPRPQSTYDANLNSFYSLPLPPSLALTTLSLQLAVSSCKAPSSFSADPSLPSAAELEDAELRYGEISDGSLARFAAVTCQRLLDKADSDALKREAQSSSLVLGPTPTGMFAALLKERRETVKGFNEKCEEEERDRLREEAEKGGAVETQGFPPIALELMAIVAEAKAERKRRGEPEPTPKVSGCESINLALACDPIALLEESRKNREAFEATLQRCRFERGDT